MAGPLDALEKLMEDAVEGSVQRVFRPKLQPVQIARAAVRRMEAEQIVGTVGPEVPGEYQIGLHPRDFVRFARFQVALQAELAKYLHKYAADRGWQPVGTVGVELVEDPSAQAGRPKVAARFADSAPQPPSGTAVLPAVAVGAARPKRSPERVHDRQPAARRAFLVDQGGERYVIGKSVARIGRALENDIVVPDTRVSRFHAEIRQQGGRFLVQDLGSTNGTLVAEREANLIEIRPGDKLSLGGYELTFQVI
jgi:hypothetical protein